MMIVETLALAVGLGMDAMSVCLGIGVRWNGWRQRFRMAWHMGLFQFLMPVTGWLIGKPFAEHIVGWGKYVAAALVFAVGAKMLHEALKRGRQRGEGVPRSTGASAREPHRLGVSPMQTVPEEQTSPSQSSANDTPTPCAGHGRDAREAHGQDARATGDAGGTPTSRCETPATRDPTRGWSLVVLSVATSLDALVVGFSLELRSPGVSIWWPSVVIGVVAAAMAMAGIVIGKTMGEKLGPWAEILGAIVLMAIGTSFVVIG